MARWRYKILKQEKLDQLIKEYDGALLIEITHQSNPGYHLKLNTPKGLTVLGRLSKNQFDKLKPVQMDQQPPYINVSWWKMPTQK